MLAEAGAAVLDTDQVVQDLYLTDSALKDDLVRAFGAEILEASGEISKPRLRERAFNHPDGKRQLEALVHPKVGERVMAFLADPSLESPLRVVLVPLLFEANLAHRFDAVWCVVVNPQDALVARLVARDQITPDEAQRRLGLQWSQEDKARRAQWVIDNSGTSEATRAQVYAALSQLGDRVS